MAPDDDAASTPVDDAPSTQAMILQRPQNMRMCSDDPRCWSSGDLERWGCIERRRCCSPVTTADDAPVVLVDAAPVTPDEDAPVAPGR